MKSLQRIDWCSWRAVGGCQPPNTLSSITLHLPNHHFTKFDEVNPCRTKVIWKVFKRKTDAVDEQLEAANHQILALALLYIFQIIFSPSLMKSILAELKLYKKSSRESLMRLTTCWRPRNLQILIIFERAPSELIQNAQLPKHTNFHPIIEIRT